MTVYNPDSSNEAEEEPIQFRRTLEQEFERDVEQTSNLEEQMEAMEIGSPDTPKENEVTSELLKKYRDVFTREGKQNMEGVEHRLRLSDETRIRQRPYITDSISQKIIDYTVEQLLKEGVIVESDSN